MLVETVNVTGETIKRGIYGIVDKVIVTKNNRGLINLVK